MDNTISIPEHQENLFEKVMPILDDYMLSKMKLQQMRMNGDYNPSIECRIKEQLAKEKSEIEQIIIK